MTLVGALGAAPAAAGAVDFLNRKARVIEDFTVANAQRIIDQLGSSSLLAGRLDLASAVVRISHSHNLAVLPADPTPPNPQELLHSPTLNELFQYVRKAHDIVLIVTSSLSSGADALIVAAKAGAALAVALVNETKLAAYTEMISELKHSNINVVGSVLNNPPLSAVSG